MPISEAQLAAKFKAALDLDSNDPEVDIEAARQRLANELAEGVAQYVNGRETTVTGTGYNGFALQNGKGVIKDTP